MSFSPALIWFFVGVIFLIAEMALPTFILIFFTFGSWIAGLCAWLVVPDLTHQIVIFILSSLLLVVSLRRYSLKTFKGRQVHGEDVSPSDTKVGKTALVTETIRPGRAGEIKMQGSFWRAMADTEIAEGCSVIVVGRYAEDGLTFLVQERDKAPVPEAE